MNRSLQARIDGNLNKARLHSMQLWKSSIQAKVRHRLLARRAKPSPVPIGPARASVIVSVASQG